MGEGNLHLIFVGVGDRDHSVARPRWASHPFPVLDDLPVGLEDPRDRRHALIIERGPLSESIAEMFRSVSWLDQALAACAGRSSVTVVPAPGVLAISIVPP